MKNSKTDDPEDFLTRRHFFRQSACAALGLTGLVNTLTHLRLMGGAMAEQGFENVANPDREPRPDIIDTKPPEPEDYRALVCLFLQGGNDSDNTMIPFDDPNYNSYAAVRSVISVPKVDGMGNVQLHELTPETFSNGVTYSLHPRLGNLASLFHQKKLAVLSNVGTLVEPTTKAGYFNGSNIVPPQLFSHSDQSVQWQSSVPDQPFTTGWGGRLADKVFNLNQNSQISMSISLAGTNSFQVGGETVQYHVSPNGSISFSGYGANYSNAYDFNTNQYLNTNAGRRLKAFHEVMALEPGHVLQESFAEKVNNAYASDILLTAALGNTPPVITVFPDSDIGDQLKMIAQLIAARGELNQKRQIFFCQIKGYDTHSNILSAHDNLMIEMGESMEAFYNATVELGIEDLVTTFTSSDFSRTFTPNGVTSSAGSDHGWGSTSFIMGGAVKGGDIYGTPPQLIVNGPDDVNNSNGRGRWLPTTSVDEYSATLARWYGLNDTQLTEIFPNLTRFQGASEDLGFMKI